MLIKKLRNYHEPLLILTLSILIFSTIYNIYLLQGTARVVNYTGLVRGATQRVVKLEIVGSPDDRLIENLDDILAGLQNGGSKYELVKLDDVKYRNDLTELANYWQELKQEIAKSREGYYTNTKLLPMSENYFILADQVVSDAEVYSQKIADRLQLLEFCMIVNVVILLIILAIYQLQSRRMQSKYKKLSATAYVDVQTGLANKSSCEKKELVSAVSVVLAVVAFSAICMMIDDLLISKLLQNLDQAFPTESSSSEAAIRIIGNLFKF